MEHVLLDVEFKDPVPGVEMKANKLPVPAKAVLKWSNGEHETVCLEFLSDEGSARDVYASSDRSLVMKFQKGQWHEESNLKEWLIFSNPQFRAFAPRVYGVWRMQWMGADLSVLVMHRVKHTLKTWLRGLASLPPDQASLNLLTDVWQDFFRFVVEVVGKGFQVPELHWNDVALTDCNHIVVVDFEKTICAPHADPYNQYWKGVKTFLRNFKAMVSGPEYQATKPAWEPLLGRYYDITKQWWHGYKKQLPCKGDIVSLGSLLRASTAGVGVETARWSQSALLQTTPRVPMDRPWKGSVATGRWMLMEEVVLSLWLVMLRAEWSESQRRGWISTGSGSYIGLRERMEDAWEWMTAILQRTGHREDHALRSTDNRNESWWLQGLLAQAFHEAFS